MLVKTQDDVAAAMAEGAAALLGEVCRADRMPEWIIAEQRRALLAEVSQLAAAEDLAGIVEMGLTAEQVAKMTADMLRPMLLKALAPMRPS